MEASTTTTTEENKETITGGESSSSQAEDISTSGKKIMSNTLANLRSCVSEFNPDETADLSNVAKRYNDWLENFEACADFEDVPEGKRRPALMALGGERFRQLCKTLEITATDTYVQVKAKLNTHFTPKKNTTAERFKFFNMRPESSEETHDRWVLRMKQKVGDCEFGKFNNDEAHQQSKTAKGHTQRHGFQEDPRGSKGT